MKLATCNLQRTAHNLQRVTCSIVFLLILGLIGCNNNNSAPPGTTTTTTLPPPQSGLVLGQIDFVKNTANLVDSTGVASPVGIAVDTVNNRLYVADTQNSRVLVFNNPSSLSNGAAANIVIGQPDFLSSFCNQDGTPSAATLCRPTAVAVDSSGNLYVADTNNNRVLVYTGTISTGMTASTVLGQSDFSSNGANAGGLGFNSLSAPAGVAVDGSGNVYVGDTGNHRVLEYNTLLSSDTTADRVFGQTDMSSNLCNQGTPATPSATTLCIPQGVAVDGSGNLYVADSNNNRVLEYDTPIVSGTTADRVFGQGTSFSTLTCPPSATATALCFPTKVGLDASSNVYIADTNNNRVLEYTTPVASVSLPQAAPITAAKVFGQGDVLTTNVCNNTVPAVGGLGAKSLCLPAGVAVDSTGNVYIADTSNSRVLQYLTPLTTDTTADVVLGQVAFTTNGTNFVDAAGLSAPKGMAVDINNNLLYVADTQNNRVLGFDLSSLATTGPASIVIGQLDMNSNRCNQGGGTTATASTLCGPRGVAVDSLGNLYVADSVNNRVLEYKTPFSSDQTADLVIGQLNFAATACGTTNATLCLPVGVAVDSAGNLYVGDTNNHRVLEYNTPISTDTVADLFFGQANFTNKICNDTSAAIGGLSAKSLCFPEGLAVDSADNLYVADTGNNRVLEYDSPLTDTTADTVFGQPGFNSLATGTSATSLFFPSTVALDSSDNLYVADTSNNRVLEYDTPLQIVSLGTSTGGNTTTTLNDTTKSFATNQFVNFLVVITGGTGAGQSSTIISNTAKKLTVSPAWGTIPDNTSIYQIRFGTVADDVFGQSGFDAGSCDSQATGGISASSLCYPEGIAVDGTGNLYVADTVNNRVLRFP